MRIRFYSSNPAKIEEAIQVFADYAIDLSVHHYEFTEIQDLHHERVVLNKINQLPYSDSDVCIVDDTGLYVAAYANFPGIMSKFIYETLGYDAFLRLFPEGVSREGFFRALVAVKIGSTIKVFEGKCDGYLATSVRGSADDGRLYEPLFIPKGKNLTLAEMPSKQRYEYSYRVKALTRAANYVQDILNKK